MQVVGKTTYKAKWLRVCAAQDWLRESTASRTAAAGAAAVAAAGAAAAGAAAVVAAAAAVVAAAAAVGRRAHSLAAEWNIYRYKVALRCTAALYTSSCRLPPCWQAASKLAQVAGLVSRRTRRGTARTMAYSSVSVRSAHSLVPCAHPGWAYLRMRTHRAPHRPGVRARAADCWRAARTPR